MLAPFNDWQSFGVRPSSGYAAIAIAISFLLTPRSLRRKGLDRPAKLNMTKAKVPDSVTIYDEDSFAKEKGGAGAKWIDNKRWEELTNSVDVESKEVKPNTLKEAKE